MAPQEQNSFIKTATILPEKLGLLNDYSGKNKNAVIRLKK